ncbi:hypothetical protein B0F90DRAFT_1727992 [Multifurca ochricompacta]|uniref:Uncharacterized protein n=1 Tax=Multifurca ochricompacta TaxID=376703 RepID=A0AAD4QMQ6_9AGAM|nr:hypothetical protein B0F90DRAFT_1727992 [Multifurca ochricompacta]
MSSACTPVHDWFSDFLTGGLILGLCISYAPQHYRIISKGSSEGFSPWFLLLEVPLLHPACSTCALIVMQHAIIACCRFYSPLDCLETVAGVIQVGTQWFLFSVILVLYLIYFPPHLKYLTLNIDSHDSPLSDRVKTNLKSDNWRLSILLSWIVLIHLAFCTFVTFILLSSSPADPSGPVRSQLDLWATFLGVSSAILAALQYAPQIVHTYRLKLVGALSVPMMMIQTPGGIIMVISIMIRPGTNWTSWVMFLVSAIMQGILLVMCICWKIRQRGLHIDDFGHPLTSPLEPELLTARESGDGEAVGEGAEEEDIVSISRDEAEEAEQAPLLGGGKRRKSRRRRWWSRGFWSIR